MSSSEDDDENGEETSVLDDAQNDPEVAAVPYDITSFGADPDVEGLVRRLKRGDIVIPEFQRSFVWRLPEASRFVESLLLGLPVPGVFFAQEQESGRLLVIDGQQRLKSLLYFYEGYFNPKPDDRRRRVFGLDNVQRRLKGKTYNELEEADRRRLDNSIIHATIVKQDSPEGDDTSVFHIFERLNSGGRKLTEQEIRCAIFHGPFIDQIKALNDLETWRGVFGAKNNRLKDQELIIRALALLYDLVHYKRPMAEFITKFARRHQHGPSEFTRECADIFTKTIAVVAQAFGRKAFRPERSLNAAVYDAVMVGLARRLRGKTKPDTAKFKRAYASLLKDKEFIAATSRSTADEKMVEQRMQASTQAFADI